MKKYILLFVILFLNSAEGLVTLNPGTILNTTTSNSSITFSNQINATYIEITSLGVFIKDATDGIKTCDINHTSFNSNIDSIDFCISPGGGGAGGGGLPTEIDYFLCNETYKYVNLYGTDPTNIHVFIKEIKNSTQKEYSWSNFYSYVQHWQLYCSDAINRTLKEKEVCNAINRLKLDYPSPSESQVLQLHSKVNISLSDNLLLHYSKYYEDLCKKKPFSIIPPTTTGKITLSIFLLIAILGLILLILTQNSKKKKLVLISSKDEEEKL